MIDIPNLPGSTEKFMESVKEAIANNFFDGREYGPWHVVAHFSDHALVRVKVDSETGGWVKHYDYDEPEGKKRACEHKVFKINFTTDAKGNVTLTDEEPKEIEFSYDVMNEGIPTLESVLSGLITPTQYYQLITDSMSGSIRVGRTYPRKQNSDAMAGGKTQTPVLAVVNTMKKRKKKKNKPVPGGTRK